MTIPAPNLFFFLTWTTTVTPTSMCISKFFTTKVVQALVSSGSCDSCLVGPSISICVSLLSVLYGVFFPKRKPSYNTLMYPYQPQILKTHKPNILPIGFLSHPSSPHSLRLGSHMASLLFLEEARNVPTAGPLHLEFSLPGTLSQQFWHGLPLCWIRVSFACHLLKDLFPKQPIQNVYSHSFSLHLASCLSA